LLEGPVFNYDIKIIKAVVFENGIKEEFINKTILTSSAIKIEDLIDKKIIEEAKFGYYYFDNKKLTSEEIESLLTKSKNDVLPELLLKHQKLQKMSKTLFVSSGTTLLLSVISLHTYVFTGGVFYGSLPIAAWFGVASGVQFISYFYISKLKSFQFNKLIETYNNTVVSE